MGSFFDYAYNETHSNINESIVYVANYKATQQKNMIEQLQSKTVWAAGSKTWFELANKNIWVQGCADAFGLAFLKSVWQMPLLNIHAEEVAIVTNNISATKWQQKGWKAYGTYHTVEKKSEAVATQIQQADIIFWTSQRQYLQFKEVLKPTAQHVCPYGETAEQFNAIGIEPIVFPNIKAFIQWKKANIQ
jgi:uroporphyrinogen-III synthase